MNHIRFTSLGHLTNDVLSNGMTPGGSALYAAVAAAEVGAKAHIVTSVGPDFVGCDILDALNIDVTTVASASTTTFENLYSNGNRHQRVLAKADPLTLPMDEADVVFACPVIGEVEPSALHKTPHSILAAGIQGWLRELDDEGHVRRKHLQHLDFLSPCDVLFMSDEDVGPDAAYLLNKFCSFCDTVVMTEGTRGAVIYLNGVPYRVHAHPANEVDPTGAGDVFAAAFLTRLASGSDPLQSATFAACAASIAVEAAGPSALPRLLKEMDERIAWYTRNVPPPAIETGRGYDLSYLRDAGIAVASSS